MRGYNWQGRASCLGESPERFFDDGAAVGRTSMRTRMQRWQAKQMCVTCPVMAECLDHAENANAIHGVFGGLDQQERALVRNASARRSELAAVARRLRYERVPMPVIGRLMRMTPRQVVELCDRHPASPTARRELCEYAAWTGVDEGLAPVAVAMRYSLPLETAEEMCRLMDGSRLYVGPTGEDRRDGRVTVSA